MTLKEFSADMLRDLVASVFNVYQDRHPLEYQRILEKMFRPETFDGKAGVVEQIVKRFKDDPLKGCDALGKVLRIAEFDMLQGIWDKLTQSDVDSLADIKQVLKGIEVKVQPGKEADAVTRQLIGDEVTRMQGNFSAAYKFNEGADKVILRFEISKKLAHGVVGLNMGVCVAIDQKLWQTPGFLNVIIWNDKGIAMGGMHLLLIKDRGKKYIVLPGINPSNGILSKIAADDIYRQLIAYAWQLVDAVGYDGILIPTDEHIHSNRSEIGRVVSAKSYRQWILSKSHSFSYEPHEYSFNSVFIVDRAERVSGNVLEGELKKGGIDLTTPQMSVETRGGDAAVVFNVDQMKLKTITEAPGMTPVIMGIQFINNLPDFLGAREDEMVELEEISA